jgi:hypothetical protein
MAWQSAARRVRSLRGASRWVIVMRSWPQRAGTVPRSTPALSRWLAKGLAERGHRAPPLQPCALGIRPELAVDPAMMPRSPTAVAEALGRGRRPPARKPAPQRRLGIGTEVYPAAPPVVVPLPNHARLGLERDVLSLQRHPCTAPNAAASQPPNNSPIPHGVKSGEDAVDLLITQPPRERLRRQQRVRRPTGGGFQLCLSEELGIDTRSTPEHGGDGAGVEAAYLEVVEDALDVGALPLQPAGWPVAIPAVHEGFQRPAVGLPGGRLTGAALDRLQPSDHSRLIRCSPVVQACWHALGDGPAGILVLWHRDLLSARRATGLVLRILAVRTQSR